MGVKQIVDSAGNQVGQCMAQASSEIKQEKFALDIGG